jgi:hypothetical protein
VGRPAQAVRGTGKYRGVEMRKTRKKILIPSKFVTQTKQVLVTINTLGDKCCAAACPGFYFDIYKSEHRCGMFQVKLRTAYVKPGHPLYDGFIRCAKCRKEETS